MQIYYKFIKKLKNFSDCGEQWYFNVYLNISNKIKKKKFNYHEAEKLFFLVFQRAWVFYQPVVWLKKMKRLIKNKNLILFFKSFAKYTWMESIFILLS